MKFEIGPNETEISESTFKSTESKSESQQSTSKLNENKVLYYKNFVKSHYFLLNSVKVQKI